MVFTTTTLFKNIQCPQGDKCTLTNCIYAHDSPTNAPPPAAASTSASAEVRQPSQTAHEPTEPATKRRKITYDSLADKPPSRADLIRNQLAATRTQQNNGSPAKPSLSSQKSSPSLSAPITPPPTTRANGTISSAPGKGLSANSQSHKTQSSAAPPKDEKVEALNPRIIPNDPAGHQKRYLYLKHLHSEMTRLNRQVEGLESQNLFLLSEQKLITLALNEEERYAREQPKVYGNVLKQRIAALKKMPVDEWLKYINTTFVDIDSPKPVAKKDQEKVIDTGLRLDYEHLILPQLVVDQKPLAGHGYIPTPPTEAQAAEAAAAVEASKNYEVCDRCSSRFQVFPGRDETGRIASNGPCFFHPYRKVFPPRQKSDRETGPKDPYYPCCNEKVGAPGCTRHEDHVFKTSSPARLAAIMPFINTPENHSPSKDRHGNEVKAVTFDCEMGYTALGMELIRLTAVSWPTGAPLLDVLVRPQGIIIDLNSRFSGVFVETINNAIPYDEWKKQQQSPTSPPPSTETGVLPIVDSPQRARELLCSFIKPTTPLIGHAIDNDLNTVRLCHPSIIDTIILYPHPKGLPMRFGLKMLTQRHLNRYIQTGGDRGHDSLEDAVATGDLVRMKVGEKWKVLKNSGWQIVNQQLVPPPPKMPPTQEALDAVKAQAEAQWAGTLERGVFGTKRKKRPSMDGADDGGDEEGENVGNGQAAGATEW